MSTASFRLDEELAIKPENGKTVEDIVLSLNPTVEDVLDVIDCYDQAVEVHFVKDYVVYSAIGMESCGDLVSIEEDSIEVVEELDVVEFKNSGVSRYDVYHNGVKVGVIHKGMLGYRNYQTWRINLTTGTLDSRDTLKQAKADVTAYFQR